MKDDPSGDWDKQADHARSQREHALNVERMEARRSLKLKQRVIIGVVLG